MADSIYGGDAAYRNAEKTLNYSFLLTVDGQEIGVSSIKGMGTNVEVIEYREGGEPIVNHKFAGKRTVNNFTVERAIIGDTDEGSALAMFFHDWDQAQYNSANRNAARPSTYRREILISALGNGVDRKAATFVAKNCWVAAVVPSDFDAMGSDVLRETITIACEEFKRIAVS